MAMGAGSAEPLETTLYAAARPFNGSEAKSCRWYTPHCTGVASGNVTENLLGHSEADAEPCRLVAIVRRKS